MKKILALLVPIVLVSCGENRTKKETAVGQRTTEEKSNTKIPEELKEEISRMLGKWHAAAGAANFEEYFFFMADDAVFMGTDPSEN